MNDKNVLEILKLTLKSQIRMTVYGETYTYQFSSDPTETDFELFDIDGVKQGYSDVVYGLACSSVLEVIGVLIQDYANDIITNIEWVK